MFILDKYFQIFSERAGDVEARKNLKDVFQKLHSALLKASPNEFHLPKSNLPIVSINVGALLKDDSFNDLDIWFLAKTDKEVEKTRGRFVTSTSKNRIEVNVEVPVKNIEQQKWKKLVEKSAAVILERAKDVLWHELTHYIDNKRIGNKKAYNKSVRATKSRDFDVYYNDPLEYNAFLQQSFTRLEDFLSTASKEDATKLIGKSADEFYKLVLQVLPPNMEKHLTRNFKNKIKKRTYQMWKDVMNKNNGGSKNV